ncbi:MAG: inorganic pyrophosphatase [Bacteroidales bacterium]
MDLPFGKLMAMRYKSHPWHGVHLGDDAPEIVTTFVEVVPSDTVKYEVDKLSGYLSLDRPQKFSNVAPTLYGFLPQTYSGELVAEFCCEKTGRTDIRGDGDPVDICVLTEKDITHGDLLVRARPIGGIRMLDNGEADDKLIAVLYGDAVFGDYQNITDCPKGILDRLRHYFLTYKDIPGEKRNCEITHIFGIEEAGEIIRRAMQDYRNKFDLNQILSLH